MLDRPDLRAAEETVRRWIAAVGLVRPAPEGGVVVLRRGRRRWRPCRPSCGATRPGSPPRELAEREALRLPPAWRVAELVGPPDDVDDLLALSRLPERATVLGPVPVRVRPPGAAGRADGPTTRRRGSAPWSRCPARRAARSRRRCVPRPAVRSARKDGAAVTVRIDPVVLG